MYGKGSAYIHPIKGLSYDYTYLRDNKRDACKKRKITISILIWKKKSEGNDYYVNYYETM